MTFVEIKFMLLALNPFITRQRKWTHTEWTWLVPTSLPYRLSSLVVVVVCLSVAVKDKATWPGPLKGLPLSLSPSLSSKAKYRFHCPVYFVFWLKMKPLAG